MSRKAATALLALCITAALLFACPMQVHAAGVPPKRFIAIVYDDSGSMRYDINKKDVYKNYIYANYSLQNLAALMESRDTAKVYLISKSGKDPVSLSRHNNLYDDLKDIGANPSGDTYAEAVNAAFREGTAFLKANSDSEFLFVLVTDGASMYGKNGKELKGSLGGLFSGFIKDSGLSQYSGRARALLLSIGTAKPLSPVTDLKASLKQAGIYAQVFVADVTSEATAGDHIMASMTDMAESMASTNMMRLQPGKPFTIRYPLESLVIMEQFQRSSGSMVKSITGSGESLARSTLYSTKAIGGIRLASTFSTVKSATGPVKPGRYTLASTGPVSVMAFAKVGFTTSIVISDNGGKEVAAFNDNKWSTGGISLSPGEKLTAKVKLVALDGTAVELGAYVKMGFGEPASFACKETKQGEFEINGTQAGHDYLNISLVDPDYFQINIPALGVDIIAPDGHTQQPSASSAPEPPVSPAPENTQLTSAPNVFDWSALDSISAQSLDILYTSSKEYKQAVQIPLAGVTKAKLKASIASPLPAGLQVRFNDTAFDRQTQTVIVDVKDNNSIIVLENADFMASGEQQLKMQFESGEAFTIHIEPKPRPMRLELSQDKLEFGVLDSRKDIPDCNYKVMIMEDGTWTEIKAKDLPVFEIAVPGGLESSIDRQSQSLSVYPSWFPVLTPVGNSSVTVHAGTGKPGETAEGSIGVIVRDDWRKWLYLAVELIIAAVLAAYALAVALKRRIPMDTEVFTSSSSDMSGAARVELARDRLRRNFWPFGREVCTVGPMEFYPHPKNDKLVILSSVCVQHGLRLDGKAPQFHKARDKAGDFIISKDTVIGIRVDGEYRYYQVIHVGMKVRKLGNSKFHI